MKAKFKKVKYTCSICGERVKVPVFKIDHTPITRTEGVMLDKRCCLNCYYEYYDEGLIGELIDVRC
jgi:hypothetical protein